jgi:hypothetical protein
MGLEEEPFFDSFEYITVILTTLFKIQFFWQFFIFQGGLKISADAAFRA